MSRQTEPLASRFIFAAAKMVTATLAVLALPSAFAQPIALGVAAVAGNASTAVISAATPTVTIGDYSDVQRGAIEADIRRAVAKSQAAIAPDVQVPALTAPLGVIPLFDGPLAKMNRPAKPPEPRMVVSGVAKLHGQWRVEIVTEAGGAQFLVLGQLVPGTPWRVESIGATSVTLIKDAPRRGGKAVFRTFDFAL